MSILDRVFTGRKKEEPETIFGKAPPTSNINPKLKERLDEIMARIDDLERQLEVIEQRLERLEPSSRSRAHDKNNNKRR